MGTWCQGLGGTSGKHVQTEHYTRWTCIACHETIPINFADPVTGEQKILVQKGQSCKV